MDTIHDGTLIHIFSLLSLEERHRSLPLVCKRWHQLANSPQLLQHVAVHLGQRPAPQAPQQQGFAAVLSLCAWLRHTAAPHVRSLRLSLEAGAQPAGALADPELVDELGASLEACGAAGRLAALRLDVDSVFWLGDRTLRALGALTSLRIDAFAGEYDAQADAFIEDRPAQDTLHLSGLAALTALRQLRLGGTQVSLEGGLPPALSSLNLDGYLDSSASDAPGASALRCLPRQLEALPALRSLGLSRVYSTSPEDYQQLSQLRQLERLSLCNCTHLPACLSALTTLHVLRLEGTPHGWYGRGGAVTAALGGALRQLALLTHLAFKSVDCLGSGLPPELGGLRHLQRFYWLQEQEERGAAAAAGAPLPPGPWLAALRQVALSSATAAANLALLSGASQLEALVVVDTLGTDTARSRYERHPAIAAWANAHASLRRLGVCASEVPWLAEKTEAWRELRTRVAHLALRPTLAIQGGAALMCELGFTALESTDTTF